jgi:RNA polymerase sigma-70 factor, ECF subfamily
MADRPAPQAAAKDGEPAPEKGVTDLAALVIAHHADVYRYAHRLCGCPIEAEDFTQQTFLIAQQKLDQLREPDRACSWLLAVVRSCFLKSIRKTRPLPMANFDTLVEKVAARTPTVEEIDRDQLATALAELPEEFRLVVVMFYFEELSYQEIAEELEIPVGTVMSRLSRGKSHLRRRLAPTEQTEPKVIPSPRGAVFGKTMKSGASGAAT